MDELIKNWFSVHPVTFTHVLTVAVFGMNIFPDSEIKEIYNNILTKLTRDGKITLEQNKKLKVEYYYNYKNGIVKDLVSILFSVGDNPNLINPDIWILDNTIGRAKNGCFPCRVRKSTKSKKKRSK